MDVIDKDLLNVLQFDFPLVERPYAELGRRLGLTEEEVLKRVEKLTDEKVVRYIGPLFDMNGLGFESTLVAMSVPQREIDRVAELISSLECVSHNYLRDDRDFNLWFTLTVPCGELKDTLKKIKDITGIEKLLDLRNEGMLRLDTRIRL